MISKCVMVRIRNCHFLIKKLKFHVVLCINKSKNLYIPEVLFGPDYRAGGKKEKSLFSLLPI